MGYTIQEIRSARALIKKIMIEEVLYNKGRENFTSLNGNDIGALFKLYDVTFFQGQIQEKIAEMGSYIEFFARSRKSGVAGLCGVKLVDGQKIYYLDIAPNIVETLFKFYPDGLYIEAGLSCKDRLSCIQLIVEHEIIHLLTIIWGFSINKNSTVNTDVYGTHGLLFQCMIEEYFGHSRYDHDLGIVLTGVVGLSEAEESSIVKGNIPNAFINYRASKNSLIGAGFENWSASCYLDSILMVLFDSISPFWRKNIMDVDISTIDYTGKIFGTAVTSIDTMDKMRSHALKIQEQIKKDYTETHADKRIVKCTILRQLLAEVVPNMRPHGKWVLFNTGAVYDAIVDVFPDLSLDIPFQIHRWIKDSSYEKGGTYISDSVDYTKESSLTMWDYMDPLTDLETAHDYKEIRWDLIDSPVLVFYNGGTPRIRNFAKDGVEKGYIYIKGDISGTVEKHAFDIFKKRSFGLTIIDDRYRLVGVITLEGVSATKEGGSHYTSHFLGVDKNWYYYNDIGAVVAKVDSLPDEGVWVEKGSSMPSMYFYQKIRGPLIEKPIRKKTVNVPHTNQPEFYVGKALEYKKIRSSADSNDISYMYFVKDKTKGLQLDPIFNKMTPFTVVDAQEGVRMWKIDEKNQVAFENEIKAINASRTKILSESVGIDSVDVGEVYKILPISANLNVSIVNYSTTTFAVVSQKPLPPLAEGGLLIRNLKYNYQGYGYIFVKEKLADIEALLNEI